MSKVLFGVVVLSVLSNFGLSAQQKPRTVRTAALAISVTDPAGTPVPNVSVTVEGPASRTTRTEGGRIAIEGIPAGSYLLRFEREGFVTLERQLTAAAGKPTDVKVTLNPVPAAPSPPAPEAAPRSATQAKSAVFDVPAVIEKEFVGRAAGKTIELACGDQGTATLIQLNQPLTGRTHPDADEFLYVVAGAGSASLEGRARPLSAGVLLFIPRGLSHSVTPSGRNPLIVLSTRAGAGC